MNFSQRLEQRSQNIWQGFYNHPFVQGIGKGDLPIEKFKYYLIQDYYYLIEYAKVFAIGVVKSNDLDVICHLSKLQDSILNIEMDLHRNYMTSLGITKEELEKQKPSCINISYTNYMLAQTNNGTLGDFLCAMLPCMWGYMEIGQYLARTFKKSETNPYQNWIDMYSSESYEEDKTYYLNLLDEFATCKSKSELDHMEEIFITTSKYEYLFWNMSYNLEGWNTPD